MRSRVGVCVVGVVLAFASRAEAQMNVLQICNGGNVEVFLGVMYSYNGWLYVGGNPDNNVHKGRGWYRMQPGECQDAFAADVVWSRRAYFAVLYTDSWGTFGSDWIEPDRNGAYSRSDPNPGRSTLFCAKPRHKWTIERRSALDAAVWCGDGHTGSDGEPWQLVPFVLQWSDPRRAGNPDDRRTYRFTLRTDRNKKAWWPTKVYR